MDKTTKKTLTTIAVFGAGFIFGFTFFAGLETSSEEASILRLQLEQCQRDVASCGDDPQLCQAIVRRYK